MSKLRYLPDLSFERKDFPKLLLLLHQNNADVRMHGTTAEIKVMWSVENKYRRLILYR